MSRNGKSLAFAAIALPIVGCASYDVSRDPSYQALVGRTVHLTEDMTLWKTGHLFNGYELTNYSGPNGGYDNYKRIIDLPAGTAIDLQRVGRMHLILSSAGLFFPQDFAVVEVAVPERHRSIRARIVGTAAGGQLGPRDGVAGYFALEDIQSHGNPIALSR